MCTETNIWSCLHLKRQYITCPKVAKERQRARSRCFYLWPVEPRDVCNRGRTHHHNYPCPQCADKARRQERDERREARRLARRAVSQQHWEQASLLGITTLLPPPPKEYRGRECGNDDRRGKSGAHDSYIEPELYGQAMSHLPPGDFAEYLRPPPMPPTPSLQGRRRERPPPLRTKSLGRELTGYSAVLVPVSPVSPGEGQAPDVSPIRPAEKSLYDSRRSKQVGEHWRNAGYD